MNKKSNPDSSGEHLNEECIFYRTIVIYIRVYINLSSIINGLIGIF